MDVCDQIRAKAGTEAMRLLSDHGIDMAAEMYKGIFMAFAISLLAVIGRDETIKLFQNLCGEFPPARTVPHLVIDNDRQSA